MIPIRCVRCHRVRYGPCEWRDHPAKLKGEVEVICATCNELQRRLAAQKYGRECRRTAQRAAKGYGPGTGDPFAGMRGE
jgi:hypothetical protein